MENHTILGNLYLDAKTKVKIQNFPNFVSVDFSVFPMFNLFNLI